jgi:lipopolysaccharide/colanic/teichoic acid biosynthesis glycosyltransferase
MNPAMKRLFSTENLLALALVLMIILIIIATTDASPTWIYQGF